MDFVNAKFLSKYSKQTPTALKRVLSDAYSTMYCESSREIDIYSAEFTNGKCFYCGEDLYDENNGVMTFRQDVEHDHLFPASMFNLYAKGNVVLACNPCNREKTDLMPIVYYEQRLLQGKSVLYPTAKDFLKAVDDFSQPYRINFPAHYAIGQLMGSEYRLLDLDKVVSDVFIKDIEILYNSEHNRPYKSGGDVAFWDYMRDTNSAIYNKYTDNTTKDFVNRSGQIADNFTLHFGKDIKDIPSDEIISFMNNYLMTKLHSESEFGKNRGFLRLTLEQMGIPSDELFTFKKAVAAL